MDQRYAGERSTDTEATHHHISVETVSLGAISPVKGHFTSQGAPSHKTDTTKMSVVLTGITANVNGIPFYISPKPLATVNCSDSRNPSQFQTIVVVRSSHDNPHAQLADKLSQFAEVDDVFQYAFAKSKLIAGKV